MAAQTFPSIPPHSTSPGQDVEFRLLEATFGDGYEQASEEGLNTKKEQWSLSWTDEDAADIQTIKTFIDTHAGATPFFWTAPGETTPKLWRCKGYKHKPNEYSGDLSMLFVRWYGPEPS